MKNETFVISKYDKDYKDIYASDAFAIKTYEGAFKILFSDEFARFKDVELYNTDTDTVEYFDDVHFNNDELNEHKAGAYFIDRILKVTITMTEKGLISLRDEIDKLLQEKEKEE